MRYSAMNTNRRLFMKGVGASALMTAGLTGGPAAFTAHAANTNGYKALVCVFLFGGMDGHDVLIPTDQASYDDFADIRQTLLAQQGATRDRSALLPLAPASDGALDGGRQLGLPPEMSRLKALFDSGDAAIVGNVGPLIEPVTRTTFEDRSARRPQRLFSHNDQQTTWQAERP